MRVFITGIQGVLGATLKTKLRSQGHDVWGCDLTHSCNPQIIRADVTNRRQLNAALDAAGHIDLVYHFAAEFGRKNGEEYFEQMWNTNMAGTQNVIQECISRDAIMVFASSSEAYGLSEDYNNGESLREEMLDVYPPRFHNQYALSKYTNERQIHTAVRNDGLNAIVLRFFNVYGPPEMFSPYRSVVCQFAYRLLTGMPIIVNRGGYRTHLWIGDWVETVSKLADWILLGTLQQKHVWGGAAGVPGLPVFNIGAKDHVSIETLYNTLCDIIKPLNPDVTFVDTEEANSATKNPNCFMAQEWLGHQANTPLGEGLEKTVEWLRRRYALSE